MRDRSPCIACKHRSPGCQSRCEIGREYFKRQQDVRDRIRVARSAEDIADGVKIERILETKKRMGR